MAKKNKLNSTACPPPRTHATLDHFVGPNDAMPSGGDSRSPATLPKAQRAIYRTGTSNHGVDTGLQSPPVGGHGKKVGDGRSD